MAYGKYEAKITVEQQVVAVLSKCRESESIDAWGVARSALGITAMQAERCLQHLVKEGKAERDGNWYKPTGSLQVEGKKELD